MATYVDLDGVRTWNDEKGTGEPVVLLHPGGGSVMFGDDDEVILEHAIALYRALPNAEVAVIPGTSHGLLVEKPSLCNTIVVDFLANDPVPTFAPIRRASA